MPVMAALTSNTITADGTYTVTTFPGMLYVLGLSGTFGSGTPGSATLTAKWVDDAGNATAFAGGAFTAAGTMTFRAPSNSVQLVLAGATDPVLVVSMPPVQGTGLGSAALADTGTGAGQVPVTGDYDTAGSSADVSGLVKSKMIVTGTLYYGPGPVTLITFATMLYNGVVNSKASYLSADSDTAAWDGTKWILSNGIGGLWTSTDDVATPDLVTTWTPNGTENGTLTVTADGPLISGVVPNTRTVNGTALSADVLLGPHDLFAFASMAATPAGRALLTAPSMAAIKTLIGVDATLDAQSHDFQYQSFGFKDTDPGKQKTAYQERSAQATIDLTVTGGSLDIVSITQLASAYQYARTLMVEEAGYAPVQIESGADDTPNTDTVTLNADPATVRITEGLSGTEGGTGEEAIEGGTRVVELSAPTLVKIHPPSLPTHRLVMVGDSIVVGDTGNASIPLRDSALAHLRRCGVWQTTAIGRGWGAWYDWQSDPGKLLQQIVFAADGTEVNAVWFALGTNDYGLSRQTPAAVQAQVETMLRMTAMIMPNAKIYVQTPLVRTTETANTLGYTLGNYRTAIAAGVTAAGGSAVATTVDGSAMLATGDLQDGVHPSATGHAKWAIAIAAAVTQTAVPAKYTASGFSTSNNFLSAASAGLADLGNGKSLIVTWFQNGSSSGDRALCGYWWGAYNGGGANGWLLVLSGATNKIYLLCRPSAVPVLANSTGAGWHCLALTFASDSTVRISLDGGAPETVSLGGNYAAGSAAAKLAIGYDWYATTGAAATEEVANLAILDYALTDGELLAASSFAKTYGSAVVAQHAIAGSRVLWTAENYDESASQATLGAFPVTLAKAGTVAKNAK